MKQDYFVGFLQICKSDTVTKKICKKCCDLIIKFHQFALVAQSIQENLFQLATIKSEDLSVENIEFEVCFANLCIFIVNVNILPFSALFRTAFLMPSSC